MPSMASAKNVEACIAACARHNIEATTSFTIASSNNAQALVSESPQQQPYSVPDKSTHTHTHVQHATKNNDDDEHKLEQITSGCTKLIPTETPAVEDSTISAEATMQGATLSRQGGPNKKTSSCGNCAMAKRTTVGRHQQQKHQQQYHQHH
jgi:hypothetical protein